MGPDLGLGDVGALAGRGDLGLELADAVLGRDQLLGLTREPLLRDPQELVDLRATLVVGELELAARLEVLQAPVDLLVVGGRVVELADQLVHPLLQFVALTGRADGDLVGLLGALALHLDLGARVVDGAVGPGEIGLRHRERPADVLGLLVRLGDRGGALLDLLREVLRLLARLEELLVGFEHALLAALRLAARGLEVLAHRVEVDAGGLELGGGSTCRRLRLQDAVGELCLRLLHLAPVRGLHVGELALERLAGVANLLLQIGLALDEVGAVGGLAALELGLRGTELVLEHRRSLLLVAQGPQLASARRRARGARDRRSCWRW